MKIRKPPPKFANTKHDYVVLDGGLDVETPPLELKSGFCRAAQNFEADILNGYTRIEGYERYDGHAKPSDATYTILTANITGAYAIGNTLTGATSAATGVIAAAVGAYFVVTKVAGTFVAGENLTIGGTTRATLTAGPVVAGAATPILHAQYLNAAADIYRADISAVPGSGKIRGIIQFNDVKYAFRDNVGATACDCYKSSAAGWVNVPLGFELRFSTGNAVIAEGTVVTGATSGATATLKRQVLQSGSYAGSTAVGKLIFTTITGAFVNAENLQVAGVTKAVSTAASAAITLLPGGRFEFDVKNFGGTVNTRRIYGCDNVNRGFEFDGTVFVPIDTGMSPDTPKFVKVFKKQLFFFFGGSAQHSGPGTPYAWTLLSGAAELATGDTITGAAVQAGTTTAGAMAIFCRNQISVLYGNSSSDWNLVNYGDETQGAIAYTIQRLGLTIMQDDRGLTSLENSIAYGNFENSVLSRRVQSLITDEKPRVISSTVVRDKNQYRVFYSDLMAFYVTMDKKSTFGGGTIAVAKAIMPILMSHSVECIWSGETVAGAEEIYFGSSDGFIYQMDRGTSFDGAEIEYFLDLAFNHSGKPRQFKRYKHGMFEISGSGYAAFNVSAALGYNASFYSQPIDRAVTTNFASANWDTGNWDTGVWDGLTLTPSEFPLEGTAENISIKLRGRSDYHAPFTLSGCIFDTSERKRLR